MSTNYLEIMKGIKGFCFDVDGVLTDGNVTLLPSGDQARTMNTRDGYALKYAVDHGYHVCIITGGRSEMVRTRLSGLGIPDIYLGAHDKEIPYEEFLSMYDLEESQVLYMGDDMPDYGVMKRVGLACCPVDAAEQIKSVSTYISPKKGGEGCVRDVIETTLKVQEKWDHDSNIQSV